MTLKNRSVIENICHCTDKKTYFTHYRILKVYVNLGIRVLKMKKVMKFMQKKWKKRYNTELHSKTEPKFSNEKKFQEESCASVKEKPLERL